jgi:hypothetical protein
VARKKKTLADIEDGDDNDNDDVSLKDSLLISFHSGSFSAFLRRTARTTRKPDRKWSRMTTTKRKAKMMIMGTTTLITVKRKMGMMVVVAVMMASVFVFASGLLLC